MRCLDGAMLAAAPGIRASGAREPAPALEMASAPPRPLVMPDARVVGTTLDEERDGVRRTVPRLAPNDVHRDSEPPLAPNTPLPVLLPGVRLCVGLTELVDRFGALEMEEIGRDRELAVVDREGGGRVQMVRPVTIGVRDGPALPPRTALALLDDSHDELGIRPGRTREVVGRVPIERLHEVGPRLERLEWGEPMRTLPVALERTKGLRLVVTRLDGNRLALDLLWLNERYRELALR